MNPINIAVLASGRGSNLQAIIDAIESNKVNAKIACVISNVPGAKALEIAKQHNIPAFTVDHKAFYNRSECEKEMIKILETYDLNLICLAGYMRIVGKDLIEKYKLKIINIHPALLPSFPGLDAQKQAVDYGVKVSGCTVHFVDEGCDTGPIIAQRIVPVFDDDTEETLSKRILIEEHILYPEVINLFAAGTIELQGRKTIIRR